MALRSDGRTGHLNTEAQSTHSNSRIWLASVAHMRQLTVPADQTAKWKIMGEIAFDFIRTDLVSQSESLAMHCFSVARCVRVWKRVIAWACAQVCFELISQFYVTRTPNDQLRVWRRKTSSCNLNSNNCSDTFVIILMWIIFSKTKNKLRHFGYLVPPKRLRRAIGMYRWCCNDADCHISGHEKCLKNGNSFLWMPNASTERDNEPVSIWQYTLPALRVCAHDCRRKHFYGVTRNN